MAGKRRLRRPHQSEVELDITAFMNLMVALVPFLLVSAVFTQISILELSLPAPGGAATSLEEKKKLALEIIVREDALEVGDRDVGLLGRIPRSADGHDYNALAKKLRELKTQFPQSLDVTILLEPDIAYDTIVQVMDTARVYETETNGRRVKAELFPAVSIGDAPKRVAAP
jgi:biopolymer transport protein ExbD